MNDADGHRIEAAEQFGFEAAQIHCGETEVYSCTEAQLIAFAKACERAGRAQIATALRQVADKQPTASIKEALLVVAGVADAINAKTDAELAPILEAEETRYMTARGYVRGPGIEPGTRWVKSARVMVIPDVGPIRFEPAPRCEGGGGWKDGDGVHPCPKCGATSEECGSVKVAPDVSHGFHVFRDGNAWCAVGPHFGCLMDSPAGFGETPHIAVYALQRDLAARRSEFYRQHALPTFEQFTVHQ